MARENFTAVMEEVFKHEGGLSMIRSDPGNWTSGTVGVGELRGTNFGIASHAHPNVDIKNLTKEQARSIYRRQYWNPIKGDDLPVGIDLVTMDPAVNSGVSRGARWLQQALGVAADGRIGPVTIGAARKANAAKTIQKACATRMGFLRGLRTWGTFGRGWSRRVASVEAVSVRMAVEAQGAKPRPVLIAEKDQAVVRAQRDQAGAGGAVAGGGATTLADIPMTGMIAIGVVLVIAIIMVLGHRKHELDRAEAYQREAEKAKP